VSESAERRVAEVDVAAIRARFLASAPWQPVQSGDQPGAGAGPGEGLRPAAVLVPLVERDDGLTVLLTRRTDHLSHHPGQISFPGGRCEDGDEGPAGTALRETEEEIGLPRDRVEVLGTVGTYVTGTGYHVTPVVGLIRPPFELRPDPDEVADVFEIPLAVVLDARNHQRNTVVTGRGRRQYHAIPHGPFYIWGATAAMLLNFRAFLQSTGGQGVS
jgi:8-oxo-dGTP pyrophosphatase MutT (NUDIX family)